MIDDLELIDAQVHVWEHDNPERPWGSEPRQVLSGVMAGGLAGYRDRGIVTDSDLLAAMAREGVDGAVLVTSASHYGFDNSYALEAADRSERFRVVGRLDPRGADLDDWIAEWRRHPATVGLRLLALGDEERAALTAGAYDSAFACAQRHGVPLCLYPVRYLPAIGRVARQFSELQLVIDHLGLAQPPMRDSDEDRFRRLPELLALAEYPNVAVKLSGAPTLSGAGYPYADLWPRIHQLVEAFGVQRLLWGTDWTRTMPALGLREQVRFVTDCNELSASEKRWLLADSLRRVFNWPGARSIEPAEA